MERRKRIRFTERNHATIRCASPGIDGHRTKAETFDISTGGARIIVHDGYDVGTVLRIRFELGRTGPSLTVDGQVKWIRPHDDSGSFEMGVEFLHLTSAKILRLIKHLYGQDWQASSPAF
ncbi:MAG: PilZ domain-containing protein [Candidatus Aminicenantales bacterium]